MGSQNITIKTETERLIFQHYSEEKAAREKLQDVVKDLKSQIDELQQELKNAKEQIKKITPENKTADKEISPKKMEYETDEEELAKETGWVRQKSRKKRKLNTSFSPPLQGTSNSEKPKVKKTPLPPPIIVENIKDYQKFYDLLLANLPKDSFNTKMMKGDRVKVNSINEDAYRNMSKVLTQNNCLCHTYENKQDRPIRVMAKNLHSSCEPLRIVEDLISKGYKILEAVNKLSWRTKEPLNMFMLSFQKDEDIKNIYNIKSILGCKVDIQPMKVSNLIPQCKRCQAYGHTQKYCSKEPRCVKCTGKHLTRDCNKTAEIKPKCVHCGEAHPANYRGCIVAKELQLLKNNKTKGIKNNNNTKEKVPVNTKVNANDSVLRKNVSYAKATKGAQPEAQQTPSPPKNNLEGKIEKILNFMTSFDDRLKKLEYACKPSTSKCP